MLSLSKPQGNKPFTNDFLKINTTFVNPSSKLGRDSNY